MTHPHPQERCGHFEVCLTVHSRRLHPGICPFDERPQNSKTGKCRHDTRTHAPAAPATDETEIVKAITDAFDRGYAVAMADIEDMGKEKERDCIKRIKAEREQVIQQFIDFGMSGKCVKTDKAVSCDAICEHDCIVCFAESLRGGATDEGGERR